MSYEKNQFRILIQATLKEVNLYKPEAEELLMGTAAQETALGRYIRQLGSGPALGAFQMEPNTFMDIMDNYLYYRPELKQRIIQVCNVKQLTPSTLMYNLKVAIIFCRLHYLRVSEPLPVTVKGMAKYWKEYYNTSLGSGTEAEFIEHYHKYVLPLNC